MTKESLKAKQQFAASLAKAEQEAKRREWIDSHGYTVLSYDPTEWEATPSGLVSITVKFPKQGDDTARAKWLDMAHPIKGRKE